MQQIYTTNSNRVNFDAIWQANPLDRYCETQGIRLQLAGVRLIGKCPLHDELNGRAFVVHPDGKWQCYGKCNRSGDVIDLNRALHGGTIREAAERLGGTITAAPGRYPVRGDGYNSGASALHAASAIKIRDEDISGAKRPPGREAIRHEGYPVGISITIRGYDRNVKKTRGKERQCIFGTL